MTTTTWVVGAGGLLGSAVVRTLMKENQSVYTSRPIDWAGPHASRDLATELSGLIRAAGTGTWQIFWCAGAGVTDSDPVRLEQEILVLRTFLDLLAQLTPSRLLSGSVVLASSAGAVYGGAAGAPFTETSAVRPLGHYGAAKLQAEVELERLSRQTGISILIGRISNLYGPGQSLIKRQGLISMLCFSTVTRIPISIYVPIDTLRDYIYVDDCSRILVACGQRLISRGSDRVRHMKIICSGQAVSVAAVLGQFRQVSGSRPLVIMGASPAATLQARDLRLRSEYWPDLDLATQTTFSAGIRQTIDQMRLDWLQPGRLAHFGT